eukprot:TRINITY_DN20154_c0_g1_i1.p1 TRINITY_DN20154_c0_g1~~TRINITY_DN20154_c0_g1_i1.p1  ORF type:complete len:935 (+),score=288.65 TRINITY_DN20154_c0_g1_i1:268-2805(+)
MARVRSTEATPEEHVLSPPHTGSASEVSLTGRTPPTMLVEGQPSESSDEGSAFQRVLLPPHHAGSAGGTDHPPVFADSHVLTHNYGNTKVTGGAAAGMLSVESLIGPPASPAIVGDLHTDACNDDLIFEYEVLKKKLIEETALSKQVQDKVHFLMLKVKAKDEQISNLRESLRRKTKMLHEKQEEEAAASTARDQLQRRVNSLEAAAMQLEYEKFQLQKPLDPTQRRTTETDEQVQQRGAEKAKLLVAHKLLQKTSDKEIDRLKALNRQQRTDFRRRLQRLEQNCMEFEDEYNAGSLHTLMNTVKYGRYQQQRDARAAIARELRFGERVSFSAPDDAHVKALLDRSNYSELLAACKSELGDPTKELKELLDRTLQSLWMLFNEKQRSPQLNQHNLQRPARRIYEDFYKAIEQTLYRSKQVVAEYARKSNSFAKAMVSREKEVTEQIRQTRYSTVDFECQTDFRPETPKEIYDLRGEVRLYQDRLKDLSVQAAEKEQSMEIRASKAESNLEYLQRRILTLHRSLFNTLHLVYKHRYRWIPRLPDPMRQLRIPEAKDRQKALEVSFNMKIGELLEHDHKYMEAFGNYMVSDEFGTNAVGNTPGQTAQKRRRSSLQPEAAAPVASSDTDGDDDGGAKEGRKKGSSSAHPPPLPGKPRSVAHGALDGGYSTLPAGERCGEDGVLRRVASQQLHKGKEAEEEAPRSIPERPLGAMGRANTMSKLPKAPPQPAPAPPRSDSIRTRRTSSSLEGDSPSPPLGRVVSQQQLGDVTAATATTSPPAPLPSFAQPIGRVKKRASLPDASPATGCYVTTTAGAPGLAPAQDCSKDALMGNLQIRKADTGRIMQSRY